MGEVPTPRPGGTIGEIRVGRPTALSDRQMLELRALVIGIAPRATQLRPGVVDVQIIRELIWRRFRVKVLMVTVGRILKKLGMTPQRPCAAPGSRIRKRGAALSEVPDSG